MGKKNELLAMEPGEVKVFKIADLCKAYRNLWLSQPIADFDRTRYVAFSNGEHTSEYGKVPSGNGEVVFSLEELDDIFEPKYVGYARKGVEDTATFGGPLFEVDEDAGGYVFNFYADDGEIRSSVKESGWGPGRGQFCGVSGDTLVTVVCRCSVKGKARR